MVHSTHSFVALVLLRKAIMWAEKTLYTVGTLLIGQHTVELIELILLKSFCLKGLNKLRNNNKL
jgi:hypothetical protein